MGMIILVILVLLLYNHMEGIFSDIYPEIVPAEWFHGVVAFNKQELYPYDWLGQHAFLSSRYFHLLSHFERKL